MKKLITMVGTSLFENYLEDNTNQIFKNYYEDLKDKKSEEYEHYKSRIVNIKNAIEDWIKKNNIKDNVSAEIKSIKKISEKFKEDNLEIYFLVSDTVLSLLAGEIIKQWLPTIVDKLEIKELKVIEGLQIWDVKEFNKGMSNLISEIYKIANYYWDNIIINITGGYKATIPFLTILAQINGCPIYYIFENTDALIKIPNIPFPKDWLDWNEIRKFEEEFNKLVNGIDTRKVYEALKNSEFYQKYSFLIWEDDKNTLAELNPLGKIIFRKYKDLFFSFYATDEVENMIEKDENLKKLFKSKFWCNELRKSKTEIKNNHKVYDDGDNQLRVFYYEENGELYVYKVFNNHDEYQRYLNKSFSKDIFDRKKYKKIVIKKEVTHV